MSKVASVVFLSPLPQLDREFDYEIPIQLNEQITFGSRVLVNFGRSKKPIEAIVVGIKNESDFSGKLSAIEAIVTTESVISVEILNTAREIASRNVSTLGEILKFFIHPHMPRSYSNTISDLAPSLPNTAALDLKGLLARPIPEISTGGTRGFFLAPPKEVTIGDEAVPSWLALYVQLAREAIARGKSAIIAVPDFRDLSVLRKHLSSQGLQDWVSDLSTDQAKSKSYSQWLKALRSDAIIAIGTRSAMFAPVKNLGLILVWDESDDSFTDQASPYLRALDVALIRQNVSGASLIFSSHCVSTEIFRLLDIGYLENLSVNFPTPRISLSEPGFRIDSPAFKAIKEGLLEGSVLVQVASPGESVWLSCKECDARACCAKCSGPLFTDSNSKLRCRWCNGYSLDYVCGCGSNQLTSGRAGSSRTATELGKAFPGVRVIESTYETKTLTVKNKNTLVVATAGAEPSVSGGYQTVVILDAQVLLSRQSLFAEEDAVRKWSNAFAKISPKGRGLLVGISGSLAQNISLWAQMEIAANQYQSRQQLSLPPAAKLGSISAEQAIVERFKELLEKTEDVQIVGIAPRDSAWRLLFRYTYSARQGIVKILKAELALFGKTSVSSATGKTSRAVRVKMSEII
ncbi:MAG: hypothetical protein ACKOXT_01790 [Actinomycetota bacterium]